MKKKKLTPKQIISQMKHDEIYDKKAIDVLEKVVEALQIIKKKKVDTSYFSACIRYGRHKALEYYNEAAEELHNKYLTQEEYDLIKEVLL